MDRWRSARGPARLAAFAAAVYTPGCILINPAALTRGLAQNLPGNVTLFEHSPVIEADHRPDVVTLKTPKGQIRAPKMILASNGYAPGFGFFSGKLLPFAAHASLTRPLDDEEHASLGSIGEWGLTPANAFAGITMRYTGPGPPDPPEHPLLRLDAPVG